MAVAYPISPSGHVKDITGKRYGKLLVLGYAYVKDGQSWWKCKCDCGAIGIKRRGNLQSGRTNSCSLSCGKTTHGHAGRHGRPSPEYESWARMIQRCCNRNRHDYPHYGGRGITVCDRWRHSFEAFLGDMGPRPGKGYSIGRIDNDQGYFPDNCRWETFQQQRNNCRTSHFLTYDNKRQTIAQWAREVGLHCDTLRMRIKLGWSVEKALTAPINSHYRTLLKE